MSSNKSISLVKDAMSSNKSFTLVKNVKPYRDGWRVQVKLLHSWKQHTSFGGHFLELVLADVIV